MKIKLGNNMVIEINNLTACIGGLITLIILLSVFYFTLVYAFLE